MKNQPRQRTEKLPPHSPEAEAGILGCILQQPAECLNSCEEARVLPEWFYELRHQVIYAAMQALHKRGRGVDLITLLEELRMSSDGLALAGGLAYLQDLPEKVASAAHLDDYLETVRERWLERRVVAECTRAVGQVYEKTSRVSEVMATLENQLLGLEEQGAAREALIKQCIREVVNKLELYHRGHAQIRGLTTGLEYADKLLCGMGGDNGNYFVLSARPNVGKTSLALQVCEHLALDYVWFDPLVQNGKPVMVARKDEESGEMVQVPAVARKQGVPVGIFSLEMTREQLAQRLLFHRSRGDLQRWRTGFAARGDFEGLTQAAGKFSEPNNIVIDDDGRTTIETLRARARRWVRQYGVRAIVVDYLQLLRSSSKRNEYRNRQEELTEISAEFRALGKELGVLLIIIAQMNRDYEKEPNRAPRLSDLKDCGAIEQDADVVGFLYKPKLRAEAEETYESLMERHYGEDWSKRPIRVDWLFEKCRNGPTGKCELLFQRSCTHFMDWNVWLKEVGGKAPAAGERHVMPTNEELGLA